MANSNSLPYWAIIPAAGVGKRMLTNKPKQYLTLAGKTVIEQTLAIFINHPLIEGIVVSISEDDAYWPEIYKSLSTNCDKPILVAPGGKERKDSVLCALHLLQKTIKQSWVLVHDAARPCLLASDIDKLINALGDDNPGGLLALPISDTLKQASNNSSQQVAKTLSRENMWRALTPQQFKLTDLIKALELFQDQQITDDSSAIELLGLKPLLVKGDSANIKITHPSDLIQAEQFILNSKSL